jgi:predicted phosphohydrolase
LITDKRAEGVILTGDISLSPLLENHLIALEARLNVPVYFVLGNHDFWDGGFDETRTKVTRLANASRFLKYMGSLPYLSLTPSTIVVGHDGWYDARNGIIDSSIMMNDWSHIAEFSRAVSPKGVDLDVIIETSRQQALFSATKMMNGIKNGIRQQRPERVVVLTHVPPFAELHENVRAGAASLPWYTSKTTGDMLISAARAYPEVQFEVFCGHSHTRVDRQVAQNMFCHVGGAEYGNPGIQGVIDV